MTDGIVPNPKKGSFYSTRQRLHRHESIVPNPKKGSFYSTVEHLQILRKIVPNPKKGVYIVVYRARGGDIL